MDAQHTSLRWWAAHLLSYWREETASEPVLALPIEENIVLVEARDYAAAQRKALRYGYQKYTIPGMPFTIDWWEEVVRTGWPLSLDELHAVEQYKVFAGLRKLVPCANPGVRPGDGTEISHSWYRFTDESTLHDALQRPDSTLPMRYLPISDSADYPYPGMGAYEPCGDTRQTQRAWSIAHILLRCRFHDSSSTDAIVLEKLHLVYADSLAEFETKSDLIGNASQAERLTIAGRTASLSYINTLRNIDLEGTGNDSLPPKSGRELTFTWYKLPSPAAATSFVRNEETDLIYINQ